MQIYKFRPYLKSVIWGGSKLPQIKGIDTSRTDIGESWEVSDVDGYESIVTEGTEMGKSLHELVCSKGATLIGQHVLDRYGNLFPLLVKFIDAHNDLSVQVHPSDELAAKRHGTLGKTEMWYILETEPGAKIYAGLSQQITPNDYDRLVAEKRIMDAVACHDSQPGDVYFLPSGCIHAIGSGNLLAEIQETSDITYRVYDYDRRDANGNLRELHTAQAREAIDYNLTESCRRHYERQAGVTKLIDCDHFEIDIVDFEGEQALTMPTDSFLLLVCVAGHCDISTGNCGTSSLSRGETALVPAATSDLVVTGQARLLLASC